MAFPTVQSRTTGASSATATSHTVTLPSTINAGDLLLVAFTCGGGSGNSITWDNSTAGTWTTISDGNQSTNVRGALYKKVASGSEDSAALSITLSTAGQAAWTIWRISGCEGAVEAVSAAGSTTTVTFSGLTPTWGTADTLWLAVGHISSTPTVSTSSTSYSNATRSASSGTSRVTTESVERELNTTSETPSAWTLSLATGHIQYTVGVRPSAASSPSHIRPATIIKSQRATMTGGS